MSVLERLLGLVAAAAYALRRSKVGFVRLQVGAALLCLVDAVCHAYRAWLMDFGVTDVCAIALCSLLLALLLSAHARRYLVFHAQPVTLPEGVADLAPEERLFFRGSGWFEVNDTRNCLVEVPVVFWTTQLGEHIIAAKVRALNILGVGVPRVERGWWYIFINPLKVVDVAVGSICFGLRVRHALRIMWATQKGPERVYLSCADRGQLCVLWKELGIKKEAPRGTRGQPRCAAAG